MFDMGFSELALVGLVALVVLGPDKLPGAARTAGLMIGRLKRSFNSIRQEVEKEIGADDIRRQLRTEELQDLRREVKAQFEAPTPNRAASSPDAMNAALDPAPGVETPAPADTHTIQPPRSPATDAAAQATEPAPSPEPVTPPAPSVSPAETDPKPRP